MKHAYKEEVDTDAPSRLIELTLTRNEGRKRQILDYLKHGTMYRLRKSLRIFVMKEHANLYANS